MTNFLKTFQNNMVAATFAEAGEWDTAREMIPDVKPNRELTWMNKIFMAVTFAESGLHTEALQLMEQDSRRNEFSSNAFEGLGLEGVRLVFGTVRLEA